MDKVHRQLEVALADHERATAEHSAQTEKLVAYMTGASGEAIASRDGDAKRWAGDRQDLHDEHTAAVGTRQGFGFGLEMVDSSRASALHRH
jgi:hypothetical protein